MIFITKIFIISAFCVGLKKMTEEGMLLHGVKNWLDNRIKSDFIFMPVIGCHYCYASIWGSFVYWLISLYGYHEVMIDQLFVMWPVICICCVFTNGVLYGILKHIENITKEA